MSGNRRTKKEAKTAGRRAGEKFRRISSEEGAEFGNPDSSDNVNMHDMSKSNVMADSVKLDVIMERLKKLDMLDSINNKLENMEKEMTDMKERINELETASEFTSSEINKLNTEKTGNEVFEKLVSQVDDLSNRLRRNNLVLINVPEGAEGNPDEGNHSVRCKNFVNRFIGNHLGLDADSIVIERAHRTPTRVTRPGAKPRPMHIAFLSYSDRQRVLNSAKNLKDNPFPGARVIVAEDLTPKLQAERKRLWAKRRELLNAKQGRKVFVNYPASLRIVEPDGTSTVMKASEI